MKTTKETLSKARQFYRGNKGKVFIAVIGPMFVASLISSLFGGVFGTITNLFLTLIASYVTIKMLLSFIRTGETKFNEAFTDGHTLLNFVGLMALFSVFGILLNEALIALFNVQGSMDMLLESLVSETTIDEEALLQASRDVLPTAILSLVITTLVKLKFFLSSYYIIDGVEIKEAIVESFKKTKGYVLSIIVFFITFALLLIALFILFVLIIVLLPDAALLLMYLLMIVVIGFVVPFFTLSQTVLFTVIDKEHQEQFSDLVQVIEEDDNDPFEKDYKF